MTASVVKSAGRVFEVLELFDAERQAMTATSIARALKYPASSTVALLKSMVSLGYLSHDPGERTYFPTIQLAAVSRWLEDSFFVEGHLLELMDDLTAATGEKVMLYWQNELSMQSIRAKPQAGVSPATRLPLFDSVVGLTALTLKRDVEIAQLAERSQAQGHGGDAKVDLPAAMELIRTFRSLGYGIGVDPQGGGTSTVAWALRHRRSSRCIVVGLTGSTERIKAETRNIIQAGRTVLKRYTGA
ncbi:MAG: helix-turn-helix domain-containing protein [Rhodospirillaceae bacterium]